MYREILEEKIHSQFSFKTVNETVYIYHIISKISSSRNKKSSDHDSITM